MYYKLTFVADNSSVALADESGAYGLLYDAGDAFRTPFRTAVDGIGLPVHAPADIGRRLTDSKLDVPARSIAPGSIVLLFIGKVQLIWRPSCRWQSNKIRHSRVQWNVF